MFIDVFLPALSLGTMLAVAVFAYISQQKALERMEDSDVPTSTLAKDGDPHGEPVDA